MELETGDFLVHLRYATLNIADESVDLQVVLCHDTRREPIVGIVRSGHGFLETLETDSTDIWHGAHGFVNDRVSGSERRCELLGGNHDRVIPRGDEAARSEGFDRRIEVFARPTGRFADSPISLAFCAWSVKMSTARLTSPVASEWVFRSSVTSVSVVSSFRAPERYQSL